MSSEDLLGYAPLLGSPFLAYVTNTDEAEIDRRLSGGSLEPHAEGALQAVLQMAAEWVMRPRRLPAVGRVLFEPPSIALARFGQRTADAEMSIANHLRHTAGGELPIIDASSDPLLAVLLQDAIDKFPVLLIPTDKSDFLGVSGVGRVRDMFRFAPRDNEAVIQALKAPGEPLARLLLGDQSVISEPRIFRSSAGRRSGLSVMSLTGHVLGSAEERLVMRGDMLTGTCFQAVVREVVEDLRKLAKGHSVEVPFATGIAGISLENATSLTTPWGTLRATDERISSGIDGVDMPTKAMLVGTVPLRLHFDVTNDEPHIVLPTPTDLADIERELTERIDKVRLLLLLACTGEASAATTATWRRVNDPTSMFAVSWSYPVSVPGLALDGGVQEELGRWSSLIETNYDNTLNLAVRRTLLAVTGSDEPGDALVDAVIALESLFGTGHTEVGFRLSTALAWLFEDDPAARYTRQQEITGLYELRSKIVHGSTSSRKLRTEKLAVKAERAAQLAVDALRTLLADRPELIRAGSERGRQLVLQAFGDAANPSG